jgi:ABC-type lipoprotein export system ATPase subunit
LSHEAIIKIKNLCKSYELGDDKKVDILKDVNLEIDATDFCVIVGPSGCGKSTLLHHIVGLEIPTSGSIKVRGTNITKLKTEERSIFRAQKFGMVYQTPYWAKALSVWENVALPLLIDGYKEKEAKHIALTSLREIEMDGYADKSPMVLSGGEQQRIGLARALVNNPWIIIADEPTGNLDTHSANLVIETLKNLNKKSKRTIIMVTHNLAYLPLATREVTMKDGQIVSSGDEAVKRQIQNELRGVI